MEKYILRILFFVLVGVSLFGQDVVPFTNNPSAHNILFKQMNVYCNDNFDYMIMEYYVPRNGNSTVTLFKSNGNKVLEKKMESTSGFNTAQYRLDDIAGGEYIVRLKADGVKTQFKRLLIDK